MSDERERPVIGLVRPASAPEIGGSDWFTSVERAFAHRDRMRRARVMDQAMRCLGRNMAVVGALSRSFDLGEISGRRHEIEGGFWDSEPPWVPNAEGKAAR